MLSTSSKHLVRAVRIETQGDTQVAVKRAWLVQVQRAVIVNRVLENAIAVDQDRILRVQFLHVVVLQVSHEEPESGTRYPEGAVKPLLIFQTCNQRVAANVKVGRCGDAELLGLAVAVVGLDGPNIAEINCRYCTDPGR